MQIFRGKIIWIVIAILIVSGSWLLTQRDGTDSRQNAIAVVPQPTATDIEATTDTDGDSLMDWEETLWKTNINNVDTDNDGTTDGEEVKTGRDPLKPGPNDKLDPEAIKTKINTASEATLTETDKFSRELFIRIIADKQSGIEPTEADYQDFLTEIVNKTKNREPLKVYRETDLKSISDDRQAIRAYGNELGRIFSTPPQEPLEHELVILSKVIEAENAKELEKFKPLIAAYENIRANLLALSVPKSALPYQLALLNANEGMIEMLKDLALIFSDPLKAMAGLARYEKTAGAFLDSFGVLKTYFANQGIAFAQTENGYKLFNDI